MLLTSKQRFVYLLWGLVTLLTLANGLAWFFQKRSVYEVELAAAMRESEIANDAFAEETQQMFRQIDLVLRGIRAYYLRTGSVEATERYINDLHLGGARIENGYLVDAQGRLVITHNPATVGRSVADRDYYNFHKETAEDRAFVSAVELGRATGKYLFRVTRRIDGPQGRFAGVSLVTVAPNAIADFYARIAHNDGTVASLISTRDRRLRARTPTPAVEAWGRILRTPLWEHIEQKPAGQFTAVGAVDGVRRHFVYRTIPEWDMVMVTGVPEVQVQARAQAALLRVSLFMAGANLVLIALAMALTYMDRHRKLLRQLANTDALTGLPNRRALLETGERELQRAQRYARSFSLLVLDVDHFKRVNDQFGHATGDRVLQAIARCARAALRDCDHFGRVGGEEFIALLPETDAQGALTLAERLRADAQACHDGLDDTGTPIPFTISVGVAVRSGEGESLADLVNRADAALYRAKAQGRNRVEVPP